MDIKSSKLLFYRNGKPKYQINDETGCWDWIASITPYGYSGGRIHRKLYIEHYGELAKYEVIDHLCRNRKCVNIHHLEAVSRKENTRRGNATKLKDKDVAVIKKSSKSVKELAKEFSVHPDTIKWKRGRKRTRENTPREKGKYKSYSLRLPLRDLKKLQKEARKQNISFNTWVLNILREAFDSPKPILDGIDDPSKYREGQVVNGEAIQD